MITVIAGTNRRNSGAAEFAKLYRQVLLAKTSMPVELLELENIAHDWFHPEMYSESQQRPSLAAVQDKYIIPASHLVFIVPEYNGGFPGALKLFLDGCSVRESKQSFHWKKAALVGIAAGRSGNVRGLEHLTGILNYLGTIVLPYRLAIAGIDRLLGPDGTVSDSGTVRVIDKQAVELLAF
ncbi:MAG: hypothetical protein RLY31_3055 [Bacteroidota bacterium]|jgi:NAD(P)H-dependent FMN reductase